jgi:PadR family transcriptional regulator, regulatory protein PadR
MPKPSDLPQAILEFLILKAISQEPAYGWGIAKSIQLPADEVLSFLYPALRRLEQQGWIGEPKETIPGCQAKCYVLTQEGRRQLEARSHLSSVELVRLGRAPTVLGHSSVRVRPQPRGSPGLP